MPTPAVLARVTAVPAKPARIRCGSTPPRNCTALSTGSPASSSKPRCAMRDPSLPRTISWLRRSVARINWIVFFCFSSAMAPAV